MSKEKIYIFDTTLRDGAQTEGVDFSVEDKNKIRRLSVAPLIAEAVKRIDNHSSVSSLFN